MSNLLRRMVQRSIAALIACLLLVPLLGPAPAVASPFPEGYPRLGQAQDTKPGYNLIVGGSSYRTHLFPLHTGPGGGIDQYAYCIEMEVEAIYGNRLFTGPWSEFPGNNNFASDASVREKVAWIVRNSYPQVGLPGVRAVAEIPGLTEKEAIAGTQAAIWGLTDSSPATGGYSYEGIVVDGGRHGPDASPEARRVGALIAYLTGPANEGREETTGPEVSISTNDGEAGSLVGPIRITSSEPTARVLGSLPHPLVTGGGAVVDPGQTPTNTDLFLDVPRDAEAGSTVISTEVTGPSSTGLLLYNTTDRTQTLMIAVSQETTVSAEGSLSWRAVPEIRTRASVKDPAGSHLPEGAPATVVDEVTYERLIAGKEYTISGELMIRGADGSATASGITSEKTFTPEESHGTINLEFKVPASTFTSEVVVVFERLYRGGQEVAVHADINDRDQSVYSPAITTRAYNYGDPGAAVSHTGGTIMDEVFYSGVEPGQTYTVTGELIDQSSGERTGITGRSTFTAEHPRGTALVEFIVPAEFAGRTLVVFEKLRLGQEPGGEVLATHEDPDDPLQTVEVDAPPTPKIRTSAWDKADGDNYLPPTERAVVVDTVEYTDLLVGKEYTVSGELMVRAANGSASPSGITAQQTFTPDSPNGTIDLEFTVAAGMLTGEVLVVYEYLFLDGVEVAAHADIDDRDQTVLRPRIETDAYNFDDPDSAVPYRGGALQDRVSFSGLGAGETYTVTGELMIRGEDGSPRATGITGETTFTAESSHGQVLVDFLVPEGYEGSDLVVFERLYQGKNLLVSHEDIDDERQRVSVQKPPAPKIRTHAINRSTGGSFLDQAAESVVVDTVTYEGLWPGREYTVSGELMTADEGGNPVGTGITAEHTFTPEREAGFVELEFTVPQGMLTGEVLVVFEHLFIDGIEIATHADITDEAQTVYRPRIDTFAYELITKGKILPSHGGTLRDEVSYAGLRPGETYIMRGQVLAHESGEETPITAETTFVADEASGTVFVDFDVPEGYASQTLVVFERLYLAADSPAPAPHIRSISAVEGERLLATHEDLGDEKQTTTVAQVPVISTLALDAATGADYLPDRGEGEVVDTVSYEGLVPGLGYRVAGELMLRGGEGSPAASGITAEETFVPEQSAGEVDLRFIVPAEELTGEVIVVFERLYRGDLEIAAHTDIDDRAQTVFRPSLETDAYNVEDPGSDLPHRGGVLRDLVTYAGLEAGETYTVSGELMDQETGEATGITAEHTFTAAGARGSVTVDFEVPRGYTGQTLVVFERLYLGEDLIAVHEDIDDERQRVDVEQPPSALPPTGAGSPLGLVGLSLLVAGCAVFLVRRVTV